jgi:hypothetical protein
MGPGADDGGVTSIIIIIFVLAIGPLAVLYGRDSRRPFDRRSL